MLASMRKSLLDQLLPLGNRNAVDLASTSAGKHSSEGGTGVQWAQPR